MPTKTLLEYEASVWSPDDKPLELIADSLEIAELELAQSLGVLRLIDGTSDPDDDSQAQVSVKDIRALCQVLVQSLNCVNDSVTHIRNVTTRLQGQTVKT